MRTPATDLIAKIRGVNRYDPNWVDTLVKLDNGKTAKRDKVVFTLKSDSEHKNILHASDRAYKIDAKGTLRRVGVKMSKADRRAEKRDKREKPGRSSRRP